MALTIEDQGTPDIQYGAGSAVASVTVNKPTGLAANDLIVFETLLFDGSVQRDITSPPSGWTLINTVNWNPSGAFYTLKRYWYRATGSDPANWTWSVSSGTAYWGWQQGAFAGGDTGSTPIDDNATASTTTANDGVTVASVTVSSNGSLLIYISNNNNGRTYTPPSDGLTWRERHEDGGTNNYWADADVNAGATGTKKFTLNSNDEHSSTLIVIKPVSGGTVTVKQLAAMGVG